MKLEDLGLPFWFDEARAGAPREQVEQLEREAGVRLPDEFRRALMLRDGGVSSFSTYRAGGREVPIPAFLGVAELLGAHRSRSRFGTPGGVLVIASGGHEWLGLDYRDGPLPRVVFQEHEGAPLEDVAASFETLLEGLRED